MVIFYIHEHVAVVELHALTWSFSGIHPGERALTHLYGYFGEEIDR
jgi:hypothetical protein